jgi:H+/Cl- antiporter ClcA
LAVGVGVAAALLAKLYGAALATLVHGIWVAAPGQLHAGPAYTLAVCTLGGALVGALGQVLPRSYGLSSWLSQAAIGTITPKLHESLAPVLALSLVTSACGFSLGPEAPMVWGRLYRC